MPRSTRQAVAGSRCAPAASTAVISVADNGIGITPESLPKVFDMFSQLEPAQAFHGWPGIGPGLVKGIIKLHGGTIEARSGRPDLCSEFTVRLPIVARKLRVADETPRVSASPLKILVVDDNVDGRHAGRGAWLLWP